MFSTRSKQLLLATLSLASSITAYSAEAPAAAWWNPEWTIRKKVTLDAAAAGVTGGEAVTGGAVLVRLHEGNFQFGAAKEDGSDIRFVAADGKTLLPYHIEKFDGLLNEAFVWVKLPELKAGTPATISLYYGNQGEKAVKAEDAKGTYDPDTVLVYHFGEHGAAASDSTSNASTAQNAGVPTDGTIIGTGLRLDGKATVKLPEAASLAWSAGGALTWSLWVKPSTLGAKEVIFSRREGGNAWIVGLDQGVPYVEVTDGSGTQQTSAGEPLAAGAWKQLTVIVSGPQTTLSVDGKSYGTVAAGLPALKSAAQIGGDAVEGGEAAPGFHGEVDELQISKVARTPGSVLFAALSEGPGDAAAKIVAVGNDEAGEHGSEGELAKHLSLITDISKSLTFDGWAVIFLCTVLALIGGVVSVMKFFYISKITKATGTFLKQWEHLAADLSVLDHGDEQSIKSMGGKASPKVQKQLKQSPLYHLYQIGFSEIQHRVVNARDEFKGLSSRSMHAIKATLDGGLVREVQRLNSQLIFLTIGIAGGPYLGLLGTVIGVMITFAVIAKSGEVEVNSIAPGIAGALLATVAGLAVAIPALFSYSYISSRIKDAVSEMQIFIDEFVAKIAEAYPEVD